MPCFSCGKGFNGTVQELLMRYKRDYLERGIEHYFFRESEKGDIKIVGKEQFNYYFDNHIKPNFKNGAEYAHIREFNE